jgi:predicted transcriptional regulator
MITTFIKFLEGLEELRFILPGECKEYCIQLLKLMYGSVNVALKFFKTYMKHLMEKVGCILAQSKMDSCVFYK